MDNATSSKAGFAPMKGSKARMSVGPRGKHGFGPRRGEDVPLGRFSEPGKFGRMFPDLQPLVPDSDALTALGLAMKEAGGDDLAPGGDNPAIPAGFTYLGQFIDHDLTFDPTSLQEILVDPQALHNFRTPKFDLDCLYGAGPVAQPYLYSRDDPDLFLIGSTSAEPNPFGEPIPTGLPNDLPRAPHSFALIGDPRNDENLAVAQTHLAFLKFHNKIVAGLRDGSVERKSPLRKSVFEEARDLTIWHYQKIVLNDFLSRVVNKDVLHSVLKDGPKFFHISRGPGFIPVEFSAAAYRFGHSMVREQYDYNRVFRAGNPDGAPPASLGLLFRFSGLSGNGSNTPIPTNWVIDWRRFYELGTNPEPNPSRLINPALTAQLHTLPGVPDPKSLAVRNLIRGMSLGLPPGQSVARFMNLEPLAPEDFTGPDGEVAKQHKFDVETPLWYYILKEAEVQEKGQCLGRVGSRIVAEVFVSLLRTDSSSFVFRKHNWDWEPTLPHETSGEYHMTDLLNFVGDINPIGDG